MLSAATKIQWLMSTAAVALSTCTAPQTSSEDGERTNSYRIISLNKKFKAETVGLAVKSLMSGKIIAVPTDTVYGVAVDATNPEALEDLYALIRRPYWKPVVMCVHSRRNVSYWGLDEIVQAPVMDLLLPGRATVLLNRRKFVYYHINPGIRDIGFRVFHNRSFITRIIKQLKRPLILSSASIWNRSHSLQIDDFRELWPGIDLIFDGGQLDSKYRLGSTVLSLVVQKRYAFYRRGCCCPEIKTMMLQQDFMNELPYFPEDNSGEELLDSSAYYPVNRGGDSKLDELDKNLP